MPNVYAKIIAALAVVAVMAGLNTRLQAASAELWPSERRSNNILFCYGNDWNAILISLYAKDNGKHKINLPKRFSEPTILEVTLPGAVEFLGATVAGQPGVKRDFEVVDLIQSGKPYRRIRVPLVNDVLSQRLIDGQNDCGIVIWHKPPEQLDDLVAWELRYGDETMAKGSSRLVTAGVVAAGRKLPKRFRFYPYGIYGTVPEDDYDRMAGFYGRFGISGMEVNWIGGLSNNPAMHKAFEANRRHGVKNIASLCTFGGKHGGTTYWLGWKDTMKLGGLVKAMDQVCAGLESEVARNDWKEAHKFFDLAAVDWEPTGPSMWPGYEDEATIAAFAEKHGIKEQLTPELLKTKYRARYWRYRMEQVSRPLYSMKKTIESVKPMPFRVEQGSGASRRIDYDVYGNDFDALSPMIYQPTPIGYARNLIETLANTTVPARKFWPVISIGWWTAGVLRESPQAFLMDVIVTAAAGCGSVTHWPPILQTDAAWFGIHEGLARIALVEDFYLDGNPVDTVSMKGIPYREEKINLGHRKLDVSAPDWQAALIFFAHKLKEEFLLTMLNYHLGEDAFINVSAPFLRGWYLVNPAEKVYQVFNDTGEAMVRVARETPGIWIATADKKRIADYRLIEANAVKAEFDKARESFLKANKKGAVQLGAVGDVNIVYGLTMFGGKERPVLQVKTPAQTLSFGSSGGRVYDWLVRGMPDFVGKKNFGTDGFGMDLLWLPAGAQWSGDETQELNLIMCNNNGKEARVVYEGMLRNGYPGIKLRKTYRVPVDGAALDIEVTLFNENVDETPVTLAYWSHHVLAFERAHFIGRELKHEMAKGKTTIFPAKTLPEEFKAHVPMPERIVGATGPVYAEFFPDEKAGLVFRLPENFMSIYRWSSFHDPACGSEWMSQPLSIPAGTSATLRFSITAVTNTTPDLLMKMMK